MNTECIPDQLEFQGLCKLKISENISCSFTGGCSPLGMWVLIYYSGLTCAATAINLFFAVAALSVWLF
jgi:hypothetical protein